MQILPGLLSGIALIFFIVKPGYTQKGRRISNRIFLDPIDYSLGKKSCSDGYVHGVDHFIITGFINVTGYTLPKVPAIFSVWYIYRWGWWPIKSTFYNLWTDNCTDMQHVPLDQCRCKYEPAITIRVKCNLTAQIQHWNKPFVLNLVTDVYDFSANKTMTKVYSDASCKIKASTNGGTSSHGGYNGMHAHIFLATALVCTVIYMVFNDK